MKFYLKTKDFFLTNEEFELFYDETYEMLMTQPVPNDLTSYYESDSYISHSDAKSNMLEKVYQMVKNINLRNKVSLLNAFVKNPKTVLDIGAGTGDFLMRAKKGGWDVHGVEPNTNARTKAAQKGVHLAADSSGFVGKKYQAITLWHVLEHLPNLKDQVSLLSSLLDKKGVLVVAVPNYRSFDAKYYKHYWAGYDVPRHLHHFSRESITKLFEEVGMELVKTKPMWFDAFYVSLLSEKYKRGKPNHIMAFVIGWVSNVLALMNKECSSIIYVLRHRG